MTKQAQGYAITPEGIKALEEHESTMAKPCPECGASPGSACVFKTGRERPYMHTVRYAS